MKAEEIIVLYGTGGANLRCPVSKCSAWKEELPYPLCTVGEINERASKHVKGHK